jgi:aminomethyltransferase
MKQTPLFKKHQDAGGKIIDFGGWALPVQYRDIIEEHEAVRQRAGLFDVSHMGELWVEGPDALAFLQQLVTNDLTRAQDGQAIYSPMCQHDGGVVDDLLLYRVAADRWLLVVNAANTEKDEAWIKSNLSGRVSLTNRSDETAQLAIQGPRAEAVLQRLTLARLADIRFYRFMTGVLITDIPVLVSRTGYTGEDGFELYFQAADAPQLWDRLLEEGRTDSLVPAGLGARDTLRFEAALPLYGQELGPDITPLEAGLNRFVKLDKPDFIGRPALLAQHEKGLSRIRTGLAMIGRGIPRSHYEVCRGDRIVGQVTSGTFAPTLKKNLALALLDTSLAVPGQAVDVIIRGKPVQAEVVELPFYSRKK